MHISSHTRTLTRRTLLGVGGLAALGGTVAAWPRLAGQDIPGRGEDVLRVAIQGTAQDAAARQDLADEFTAENPDIPVRIEAIQAVDWGDFFTKILTMVASGTAPDVVYVATEGAQLFAERLAEPLDDWITHDEAALENYFEDVHPSLIEAFMYQGSLYVLPLDFNAANMYLNLPTLERAGLDFPSPDWDIDEFEQMLRTMRDTAEGGFVPYFWTNRLFGGIVPWLYANDTSILTEDRFSGGDWLWDRFYTPELTAERRGGYRWTSSNVSDPRVVETFERLQGWVNEGLSIRPEEGGGNSLIGLFASDRIGATPAGGYWAQGLHENGMSDEDVDVQYFPRWRSQRHQFGTAGYSIMRTSERKEQAWRWLEFTTRKESMELAMPVPTTTPTRRSMVDEAFYRETGPRNWKVFYDTLDDFPSSGPIPAPPQQAEVENALARNVALGMSGGPAQLETALDRLDRELTVAMEKSS
ncbi:MULTISPECIES: ABC transporter substrate-binding protein [Nesterenkonia]|uniref:ABC-type glycerol-3-phosphate transport system substrate-binding protein n=1 Tax=Nesterenkonia xinjiangensis TaxID=225327 RepID=A0A7Z0GLP6_9MICC|nr:MULTISPECIES: sugar ABC transporter substrate-binding protein [Nesterenkonia]MDZ5076840.1 sugar ABC transporter substrate-binding protein [Nesterenkonia sp. HG001]NYJ77158.1 ABC-type glycerol-3-phosphate transport system substrate-binding protein [Nesterenkonia xinjiangensis]